MDIQNYSSIFELFCVFNFGYILTEPYRTNEYVLNLGDKILRCFTSVRNELEELSDTLKGHSTSLSSVKEPDHPAFKTKLKQIRIEFEAFHKDFEESMEGWKRSMSSVFKTPSFVYLNFLLALYCIIVLVIGGLYSDKTPNSNGGYDSMLVALNGLTLVFLVFGWWIDSKSDLAISLTYRLKRQKGMVNWFIMVLVYLLLSIVIAVVFYHHVDLGLNDNIHNAIILTSILLPSANFVMYFFKIRSRAKSKRKAIEDAFAKHRERVVPIFNNLDYILKACTDLNSGDDITIES